METQSNFYNTINLNGSELLEAVNKCKGQDKLVYAFFQNNPGACFSPFQVLKILGKLRPDVITDRTPKFSIARSISTLTKNKFLIKTKEMIQEELGRPNYLWKLNTEREKGLSKEILTDIQTICSDYKQGIQAKLF